MIRLIQPDFLNAPESVDIVKLKAHRCDLHFILPEAACSVWWTEVPALPGEKLGVIGHFQAINSSSALELLDAASTELQSKGCSLVVGPMDGNTWRPYRFVTERGTEPPFLLEPWNPIDFPAWFEQAGFVPMSHYNSHLNANLDYRDPRAMRVQERLFENGITIRTLNLDDYENELERIYQVSLVSFTKNYLYTPLDKTDFMHLYLRFRDRIVPGLVLLAEHEARPVGFIFGYPDYGQLAYQETINTVVGKTLAILPGRVYAGLGVVLVDLFNQASLNLGYSRVIHALQNERNKVVNMSEHHGHVMRRYTLYQKRLA